MYFTTPLLLLSAAFALTQLEIAISQYRYIDPGRYNRVKHEVIRTQCQSFTLDFHMNLTDITRFLLESRQLYVTPRDVCLHLLTFLGGGVHPLKILGRLRNDDTLDEDEPSSIF